jgi:uncharacterized protein (TIGR02246 family)
VDGEREIAELTRLAFARWNDRDFDGLLELFEERAVWDMSPAEIPGMGEYRGHEAIRKWFDQWLEVFPDSSVEVEDVEVRFDWGLVTIVQHASGSSSGAPAPFRYYGVGQWRDGRLVLVENYMDPDKARTAFRNYTEERAREPEAVR